MCPSPRGICAECFRQVKKQLDALQKSDVVEPLSYPRLITVLEVHDDGVKGECVLEMG